MLSLRIRLFRERLREKYNTLFLTTVPVKPTFCYFPLALPNTFPRPFVPILSNFFKEQ